ncbi:hypothetical protein C0Q70_14005 [Pomacea canaliculata]|uniref:Uncharacterized protein n=1 Tax=Pomacea canaliculata TaxID=400727 RepID=A0A2T7NYU3_POMCA|nr:hypothetical protein C0Q70_14005 [Pomacea canaliculata]
MISLYPHNLGHPKVSTLGNNGGADDGSLTLIWPSDLFTLISCVFLEPPCVSLPPAVSQIARLGPQCRSLKSATRRPPRLRSDGVRHDEDSRVMQDLTLSPRASRSDPHDSIDFSVQFLAGG